MTTPMWLHKERKKAYRYAVALRHLLGTGLKPLTYDDELCKWDGDLLPLEPMDRGYMMEKDVQHGTTAGYQYHRRKGQNPCDDCRAAQSAYNRASRIRRNGRNSD
jgi:hypothetical protein